VVSYQDDLVPLFETFSCTICHTTISPQGTLVVMPYASLITNDVEPHEVIPRRSAESLLVRRLLPSTPPPLRMPNDPPFVPYLNEQEILLVADWIDQGARDN
jgi:hypothetical protein